MAEFLHGKGQILWDITVNTTYVHLIDFLDLGSRDMFNANNKAVDYLYCSLCLLMLLSLTTKCAQTAMAPRMLVGIP
jgi:hypothetical protein